MAQILPLPTPALRRALGWVLVLSSCAVLPSWLAAQTPTDASFSERVDVDLVQLRVTVTDGGGRPVSGLGRDDFQVRYGGKKVGISLFSAVQLAESAGAGEIGMAPEPGDDEMTVVVLLVDRDHLDGGLSDDALTAIGAFVDAGPAGRGGTMVLAARGDRLEMVQPMTADGVVVQEALLDLDLRPSAATAAVEYRRLLHEIRRVEERPDTESLSRSELPIALKAQIEALSHQVYRELAQLTLHVDRAILGLAGMPGRRELVLVTGALPSQVSKQLNDAWSRAFGNQSDLASRPSLTTTSGGVERLHNQAAESGVQTAETGELFDLLAQRANAQGVTLHVLSAVGGGDASLRVDDPAVLARLAERTGGRAVIGQEAHRVLDAVRDDLRGHYLLAFSPPGEVAGKSSDGGSAVEVKVQLDRRHKGLRVSHRHAVRARNLQERATLAAVSALLLGSEGKGSGGLGLTVQSPTKLEDRDDVLRLPATVLIPLGHLTLVEAEAGGRQGRVSLFFTTGDLEAGASDVRNVLLPLQLTADQLQGIEERKIEFSIDVPMDPRARRVAVALRDDLSGDILTASAEIQRLRLTP